MEKAGRLPFLLPLIFWKPFLYLRYLWLLCLGIWCWFVYWIIEGTSSILTIRYVKVLYTFYFKTLGIRFQKVKYEFHSDLLLIKILWLTDYDYELLTLNCVFKAQIKKTKKISYNWHWYRKDCHSYCSISFRISHTSVCVIYVCLCHYRHTLRLLGARLHVSVASLACEFVCALC